MIAIDRMMPGSPPAGFTFARTGRGGEGKWTVVEDPTASVGRAIEQSSTDRTDYRFPLAIQDSLSAANLDVELRFKAVGGEIDQTANEWHTLGLRAEGERFSVSYDGKALFSLTDKTFTQAGGVALWTKADSVTRFDHLKITTLPQGSD